MNWNQAKNRQFLNHGAYAKIMILTFAMIAVCAVVNAFATRQT